MGPSGSLFPREPRCYPAAWVHKCESGLTPGELFPGPDLDIEETSVAPAS